MKVMMLGPRLDVRGGVATVSNLILENAPEEVEIVFRPSMNDKSLAGRLTHWIARIVKFPYERFVLRPDIVHIHFSHSLSTWRKIALASIWRLFGVPVIMHAHSSDYKEFFPSLPRPLRWLVGSSIRKSTLLIVLSESWKDYYVNRLGMDEDRVRVFPNAIKIPDDKVAKEDSVLSVLFSGRIGKRKGAFDLIAAWSKMLPETRSKAILNITGDGQVEKARRLVEDLDLSESVNVLGWIPIGELEYLFSSSEIFVLPSRNEGLPMGLIEAMSHSAAVVTTSVGGIPEVITHGENGLLVEPGDINSIRQAVEHLILDDGDRDRYSRAARKSVEALDIVKYMENLVSAWDELVR